MCCRVQNPQQNLLIMQMFKSNSRKNKLEHNQIRGIKRSLPSFFLPFPPLWVSQSQKQIS
jgi:hypothetical protein